MNKSSFFIVGQHAVIEALKNPQRKVLRLFLTEESKKNIHRKSPKKNLLEDVKVYFKTKKELDKYSTKEGLLHQGYVAEIEYLQKPILKEFIKIFDVDFIERWCPRTDSNRGPIDYKSIALPAELQGRGY